MTDRENNADRVISHFCVGKAWYSKKDKMSLNENNEILDNGLIIGKLETICYNDEPYSYLILSLSNYRARSANIKRHKAQLAKAANTQGIIVIYVDSLDIGFGDIDYTKHDIIDIDDIAVKLYKLFGDKGLFCWSQSYNEIKYEYYKEPLYYAENQIVEGRGVVSATDAICYYLKRDEGEVDRVDDLRLQFMYGEEPDYFDLDEITRLRDVGFVVNYIYYLSTHSYKLDTPEYSDLVTQIRNHELVNSNKSLILYNYYINDKVNKIIKRRYEGGNL